MLDCETKHNKRLHSDKIKLRRFALHLYFSGEAKRLGAIHEGNIITNQEEDDGIGGGP